MAYLENQGFCNNCEKITTFVSESSWLRDNYLCCNCGSVPRERALMDVIELYYPGWRSLSVHESSPSARGASARLQRECAGYIGSQYWPAVPGGSFVAGVRCENLEALSFPDGSVDLHITQDVMEHIFNPYKAFSEIARTLRPGGAHICTVPMVQKERASRRRAMINARGQVEHIQPAEFHGNPVSVDGILVTIDWGFDICTHIFRASGLPTHVVRIENLSRGISGEYIEVLVTSKPIDSSLQLL